jgi:sterol 14-demethylase
VATSPNFNHILPQVFKDPTAYDPERWVAPRDEDKATPYGFVGFGAGRHSCMGANFAYLQIKSIWSCLLRNFEFELLDPVPAADYETMVVGPKPCRVRFTRRKI